VIALWFETAQGDLAVQLTGPGGEVADSGRAAASAIRAYIDPPPPRADRF